MGRPPLRKLPAEPVGVLEHDPEDDQPDVAAQPSAPTPPPFAREPPAAPLVTGDRRNRLTDSQRQEIIEESATTSVATLAARYGVTSGAIYAMLRKENPDAAQHRTRTSAPRVPQPMMQTPQSTHSESILRTRLVSYAVRQLLGQTIEPDEVKTLEEEVRAEMLSRLIQGL